MEISSKQVGSKLSVEVVNVTDVSGVLETIEGCADGSCACSTDEYLKVDSMRITPGSDSLMLDIVVKPGEVIDPACISECLAPESE